MIQNCLGLGRGPAAARGVPEHVMKTTRRSTPRDGEGVAEPAVPVPDPTAVVRHDQHIQVMPFAAPSAIPRPTMIPARADVLPPSPKANRRSPITIDTSASPRAIGPVNAVDKIRHRIHPGRRALRQDRRLEDGHRHQRRQHTPRSAHRLHLVSLVTPHPPTHNAHGPAGRVPHGRGDGA